MILEVLLRPKIVEAAGFVIPATYLAAAPGRAKPRPPPNAC
jgi:hypothetical protein